MQTPKILSQIFDTPLGEATIAATDSGVCLLQFNSQVKRLEREIADLKKRLKMDIVSDSNRYIEQAQNELNQYFNKQREQFTVNLDPQGTVFQQSVWQVLLDIPYGKTVSYLQQAQMLNKPSAVRAVANANGANKISLLIPCHRVIGSDGKLTGYGGGIERKQWLLDLESKSL